MVLDKNVHINPVGSSASTIEPTTRDLGGLACHGEGRVLGAGKWEPATANNSPAEAARKVLGRRST